MYIIYYKYNFDVTIDIIHEIVHKKKRVVSFIEITNLDIYIFY